MGAKHFSVKLDKYTHNQVEKIQRRFEDETGLSITKTNIIRQAIVNYRKFLNGKTTIPFNMYKRNGDD